MSKLMSETEYREIITKSKAGLGELECSECTHALKYHLDKYGCEIERRDGYRGGSEVLEAMGPCSCEGGTNSEKGIISLLRKLKQTEDQSRTAGADMIPEGDSDDTGT